MTFAHARSAAALTLAFSASLASADVTPLPLGYAGNGFSPHNPFANQVAASDRLDMVVFIHTQDHTIWGGGESASGQLRYDLSVENGINFAPDVGVLNPVYTRRSYLPNVVIHNDSF